MGWIGCFAALRLVDRCGDWSDFNHSVFRFENMQEEERGGRVWAVDRGGWRDIDMLSSSEYVHG